ncbi:hypothetical protein CXT86_03795 [Akkermansia muciniphila]|nr:hypothetical protein CXT86_03795 [Akkermansia muciniphila]PND09516.1 hypothetical protein CXT85_08405 [Akkermansia muciniphila]
MEKQASRNAANLCGRNRQKGHRRTLPPSFCLPGLLRPFNVRKTYSIPASPDTEENRHSP